MSFVYMVSDMSSFETIAMFRFVAVAGCCFVVAVNTSSRVLLFLGPLENVGLLGIIEKCLSICSRGCLKRVKTSSRHMRTCARSIASHCSFIQFILFRLSARARGELLGIAKCFYMFCGRLRMLCAIYVGCFVYVLGMLGNVRAGYTPHSAAYLHTSQNPHNTPHRLL